MKMRRLMLLMLVIANLAALPVLAKAQALVDSGDSSSSTVDHSAGMETRRGGLQQAIQVQLRHRRGNYDDALCALGSLPRRLVVLPL
jgi:hypothetical protein